MPEVGDIVLYRLVVSEFYGIEKEKKTLLQDTFFRRRWL